MNLTRLRKSLNNTQPYVSNPCSLKWSTYPRKRHTLEKFLINEAFVHVLDTGNRETLDLYTVYNEKGLEFAWLFYCCIIFYERHSPFDVIKEFQRLWREFQFVTYNILPDKLQVKLNYFMTDLNKIVSYKKWPNDHMRNPYRLIKRKRNWRVYPNIQTNIQLIHLADLLIIIYNTYKAEKFNIQLDNSFMGNLYPHFHQLLVEIQDCDCDTKSE